VSQYRLAVFLFLGHAALLPAVTAILLVLMSPSRKPDASGHFRTEPVAVSRTRRVLPSPDAVIGPLKGNAPAPPHGSVSSLGVSRDEAPAAAEPPVLAVPPPPDEGAPDAGVAPAAAVQSSSDDEVAALQQLVAQSRQETEQLRLIDDQLTAQRQRAADDDARRLGEAEQQAAQRAARLAALGTLRQAEAQLASGNSDGVDDELSSVEAVLSGRTQLDLQAAREALARGDLFQAGQYLAAALTERRSRR
jgi:hypothetical protein